MLSIPIMDPNSFYKKKCTSCKGCCYDQQFNLLEGAFRCDQCADLHCPGCSKNLETCPDCDEKFDFKRRFCCYMQPCPCCERRVCWLCCWNPNLDACNKCVEHWLPCSWCKGTRIPNRDYPLGPYHRHKICTSCGKTACSNCLGEFFDDEICNECMPIDALHIN